MELRSLLAQRGLRRTRVREAVLGCLMKAARPLAPSELSADPALEGFDRVSVYRSLAALQSAGLVHGVCGVDGVSRYRAHGSGESGCPGGHPHFLCTGCGGMWCLAEQGLPHVQVPPGVTVHGKQLVVHGRCARCGEEPG
jgi:Fur family ferric uptake transcriptional regulator